MLSRAPGGAIRSFVAVLLPGTVRAALHAAGGDLRRRAPGVAWVREENLHLTLRFLGGLDEVTLSRIRAVVETVAGETAPFRVTFGGLGGFPPARAPRVLWVGVVEGGEALVALHGRLERALAAVGIPGEGQPFHPHVTLGRARGPRGEPALASGLGAVTGPLGELAVEALHLMRSDLARTGAQYSVLAASSFRLPRDEHSTPVDSPGRWP